MAKTLVIKGADFSANRVAVVEFSGIPCENITFAQSSYQIDSAEPVMVQYTLTPDNTTDRVLWSSENDDVVTMNGNVMTIVGLGSTTITAQCGTKRASATVSIASIVATGIDWTFASCNKSSAGGNYPQINSPDYNRIAVFAPYGQGVGMRIGKNKASQPDGAVIVMPKGTKKLRVIATTNINDFWPDNGSAVTWCRNVSCGDAGYLDYATFVQQEIYSARSLPKDFTVPDGVDSFIAFFRFMTARTETDNPASVAASYGLQFQFLAE